MNLLNYYLFFINLVLTFFIFNYINFKSNEQKKQDIIEIIIDTVSFNIIIIGLLSTLFLVLNKYSTTLVLSIISLCLLMYLLKNKIFGSKIKFYISLSSIVLIILALFIMPFVIGRYEIIDMGQDAGAYPAKGIYFAKQGKFYVDLDIREKLSDEAKQIYDNDNLNKNHFLPPTYLYNNKSSYYFQFYTGWSLILSTWGNIFGINNMFYIMVLIFFLSIFIFYFFLLKLNIEKKYSFLGVILLSTSPLIIFFTKYPTSELFQLFLFNYSAYLLVKKNYIDAIKAGLVLTLFSFTHIGFFMYIPILFLFIPFMYKFKIYYLSTFLIISFISFLSSILFGLFTSELYFKHIYTSAFEKILNFNNVYLAGIIIIISITLIGLLLSIDGLKLFLKEKKDATA